MEPPVGRVWCLLFLFCSSLRAVQLSSATNKDTSRRPRQVPEVLIHIGVWGQWSPWSACTQSCGFGIMERKRICQSPVLEAWQEQASLPYSQHDTPHRRVYGSVVSAVRPGSNQAYPSVDASFFTRHTDRNRQTSSQSRYPSAASRNPISVYRSDSETQDALPNRQDSASFHHQDQLGSSQRVVSLYRPDSHSVGDSAAQWRPSIAQDPGLPSQGFSEAWSLPRTDSLTFRGQRQPSEQGRAGGGSRQGSSESHSSRRISARNSIRPGQYGYGKVPFSLPLHRDRSEHKVRKSRKAHHRDEERRKVSQHNSTHDEESRTFMELDDPEKHKSEKTQHSVSLHPQQLLGTVLSMNTESGSTGKEKGKESTRLVELQRDYWGTQPLHNFTKEDFHKSDESVFEQRQSVLENLDTGLKLLNSRNRRSMHESQSLLNPKQRRAAESEKTSDVLATVSTLSQRSSAETLPEGATQEYKHTEKPPRGSSSKGQQFYGEVSQSDGHINQTVYSAPAYSSQVRKQHVLNSADTKQYSRSLSRPHQDTSYDHLRSSSRFHVQSAAPVSHLSRSRTQRQWDRIYIDPSVQPQQGAPRFPRPDNLQHGPNILNLHSRDSAPLMNFNREGELATNADAISTTNWNLYSPRSVSYTCDGKQKEYKSCHLEPCPGGPVDPRKAQCSAYNEQEYIGRKYDWEPFTEVGKHERCELNCRPIGYKFYVRHAVMVQDGTPCQSNSSEICVVGECLSPGCDGVLGSNRVVDSCGVCGGDSTTCQRVGGTFQNSSIPIGYYRFLEIPPGATHINITEREQSPNYLALRTASGHSVINGRWAVDPPGRYEAAGTVFEYRRPNELGSNAGETLMATGPTTAMLYVYIIFHKKNPGVDYEFYLPVEKKAMAPVQHLFIPRQQFTPARTGSLSQASQQGPQEPPLAVPPARDPILVPSGGGYRGEAPSRGTGPQRNVRIPPRTDVPLDSPPDYQWIKAGLTDCTASCGKGFQYPVYRCIDRKTQEKVPERRCDPAAKPTPTEEFCNVQPCPAFWEVGEWSDCSKTCGPGIQHRQVHCRQVYANRSSMVHPQRCATLQKPNNTQHCQLRICSHWEIGTDWSACSVMCGVGERTRTVRCISNQGSVVNDRECNVQLQPISSETCDMGHCVRSWFFSNWNNMCSAECGTGVQRRSVVCLSNYPNGQSDQGCSGTRPPDLRACNGGPCEPTTRWFTGPWSECNVECGNGTQRRDLICVKKLGTDFNLTDPQECAHLEKPSQIQTCSPGPCREKWYTTQWSACSRSCMGGVQMREVRCLTEQNTLSEQCDASVKPVEKQSCNTQPCTLEIDENCRDKHHNCSVVVQARLCVYAYYKNVCCASCTRAAERAKRHQ
uniref:PLAC domain-containing protein n=1 Tax=Erpetoichthys calabaricus TaxID=27687 RepID=A0A8C4SA58_ERPCA